MKTYTDEELMDLLERPEDWPDDPALQARLAGLLELDLALHAHRDELRGTGLVQGRRGLPVWLSAAAAAVILVLLPAGMVLRQSRQLQAHARLQIEKQARLREQERAWVAFFGKSAMLVRDFQDTGTPCAEGSRSEDRSLEREAAQDLLRDSHQLAALGAPLPEAEAMRQKVHAWLTEVATGDSCLSPDREQELRRWAEHADIGDGSEQLGRLLKGDVA